MVAQPDKRICTFLRFFSFKSLISKPKSSRILSLGVSSIISFTPQYITHVVGACFIFSVTQRRSKATLALWMVFMEQLFARSLRWTRRRFASPRSMLCVVGVEDPMVGRSLLVLDCSSCSRWVTRDCSVLMLRTQS